VFNRYGPTETTISVTNFELTPDVVEGGQVPIGLPHAGTSFHIVDEGGRIVKDSNVIGELYVGGSQLMLGYLGEPELTAQVIREDVVEGERVYKTGDLVFRNDAGLYVYFDRVDRVIKRSGVRISLVELTQTMQGISGVKSAVCSAFDDSGRLGIVAFVVLDEPKTPLELQVAAREKLPATMIPDLFEVVDALPLTGSNKVDEQSLLRLSGLRAAPRAGTVDTVAAGSC
jgi:acyl-CoA synthetase (AMP-forming)/AMP-acid ligase II